MEGRDIGSGKVLYVTVLYRQRLQDTNAYKTLLHDRDAVYIQDNSPEQDSGKPDIPDSWVYRREPSNPGLSCAYNSAAEYAEENGFEWLVITDQDTLYAAGAAERYEKNPFLYPEERVFLPKVRIPDGRYISPLSKNNYFTKPAAKPLTGHINLLDSAVINSGLMVRTHDFIEAGGYNEKVFLDFSDLQFIERLGHIVPTAFVTEEESLQSFSAVTDSGESQKNRYRLFCRSLKGFESENLIDKLSLNVVILKRALSLVLSTKGFWPLKILVKDYFLFRCDADTRSRLRLHPLKFLNARAADF